MNKLIRVVVCCCLPTLLWADDGGDFEAKFNAIRTMQATFNQVVFSKAQAKHTSSGVMALHRPGQFRWETKEPMAQVVVADGARLWVYDVLLEQVTVRKQRQIADSSAALFLNTDEGKIARAYRVVAAVKSDDVRYDLFAKSSHTDFKHVIFQFHRHELVHLELFDTLGQRTEVTFNHIKINTPLKANLFTFKPPKGVDVVDEAGEERA